MKTDVEQLRTTLAKLRELIEREHTPEQHEDLGGMVILTYCAGCGIDLDDEECPYLSAINEA